MARKIATFLVLCMFLATLPALGAKAVKTYTPSQYQVASEKPINENLSLRSDTYTSTGKYTQSESAMGYASPDAAFVGYQMGSTWYDYQHNSTMGRQVALGADHRVHVDWMYLPGEVGTRGVRYNSMIYNTGIPVGWQNSHSATGISLTGINGAGYCQMGVYNNRAVAAYHYNNGTYYSWAGIDASPGSGSFSKYNAPDSACPYHQTGFSEDEYIWPVLDVEDHGGSFTVHMVSSEYDTSASTSIVYFRANGTTFGTGMFGDCGVWIDSTISVSPVVCADRNSDNVAVVYSEPRFWHDPDPLLNGLFSGYNDIWYRESTDDGLTFGPSQPVTDTTSFPDADSLFALNDISALYDASGDLHVVFLTGWEWPDPASDTLAYYYPSPGRIYHWDKTSDAVTLVVSGQNVHNCGGSVTTPDGRNGRNVCKPNLVECSNGNLYMTYTYFWGDANADPSTDDCSAGHYANGDLYVQTSETGGLTWGPPVNLSNTNSNGCAVGACFSENWASAAPYADSLYILYIGDKDAGGWAGGGSGYEGQPTDNPVMMYVHPCFNMVTFVELSVSPEGFLDPFHRAPGQSYDTTFVITNLGNTDANCTISESPSVGWLSASPTSPSITPAVNNTATVHLSGTAPGTEGLYHTDVVIDYNDSKGQITIPVDLYVFTNFFIPEDAAIRTAANRLNVAQDSRVGDQEPGAQFSWFSDGSNYLYDGSLILGYNANNMFTDIFYQLGDTAADDNPLRELRALSHTSYDSTSFPYRYAEGYGCTADSTVSFRAQFYASKHPDSANFYVGRYSLYAGPNTAVGTPVTGLIVGYATDWDIPSDSGSDNYGHVDSSMQMVYQQGALLGSPDHNETRFGGIAYRGNDDSDTLALGGWYWLNSHYVYPDPATNATGGYSADSLYKYMTTVNTWGPQPFAGIVDSVDDLNSIIAISKNATLTWSGSDADSMIFYIIFAASNDGADKSVSNLKDGVKKGEKFICTYINPDGPFCLACYCGDADGNGIVNISDAVFLIAYIFGGGDAPNPLCQGDADGNAIVNISDAVYLIAYIFGGGDPPHCP